MANDDKALTFVGQIMTAYNAAEKDGATAFSHALECGKCLNLAKENVDLAKGKGKWKKWCETNLPKVSEETERLYRRLAEAVAKKEDIFAKCKSIRDAIKHLSGLDENLNPKPAPARRPPKQPGTGSTAAGLAPPEADTPSTGLAAELEHAAADEIISNLQHDADKLEELAQASIARMTPDKVCGALTKAWGADQLRDLSRRLVAHLNTLTPPGADLSIPSSFRRPVVETAQPPR